MDMYRGFYGIFTAQIDLGVLREDLYIFTIMEYYGFRFTKINKNNIFKKDKIYI